MLEEKFSIQKAAAALGRSTGSLRQLERDGVLPAPARDLNGRRVYTPADLQRMAQILFPETEEQTSATA